MGFFSEMSHMAGEGLGRAWDKGISACGSVVKHCKTAPFNTSEKRSFAAITHYLQNEKAYYRDPDPTVMTKIVELYNDCGLNDQQAILNNLSQQRNETNSKIHDLENNHNSQHFSLFGPRVTKEEQIKLLKHYRDRIDNVSNAVQKNQNQLKAY